MKLLVNAEYDTIKPFLRNLPELFKHQGRTVYKSRNELRVIELQDLSINVKQYRIPIFINRFIYTFFRKSKACRAYEYAMILKKKGFGTPDPIAYLELKSKGLLSSSYFVSRQVFDFRMMREFADGSDITGREDIIEALGVFVAHLHQAGILHLDSV
jgi:tRNA A-37 threonylcarbamoyl transferase component Bud32